MTWIQFFMWMTIIYLVYYGLNILVDVARIGKRGNGITADNHLTFSEDIKPQMLYEDMDNQTMDDYTDEIEFAGSPDENNEAVFGFDNSVASTGGVSLKDLFSLARAEAIEFTRPVTF